MTSSTDGDRSWQEVDDILFSSLELPEAEREDAIAAACRKHPTLADRLRRCWDRVRSLSLTERTAEPSNHELGGYRLLRRIGSGGMGVVYLAEQKGLGRRVALKVIRPELLGSARMRDRFQREVEAAASIEHPALCTIFEAGEADGTPYLAMQYVPGRTLAQHLDERRDPASEGPHGPFEIRTATAFVAALAQGLHVAHTRGFVHRDVKPANVMVRPDGAPVLLDFGLVRAIDSASGITVTAEQVGSPAYMSPEQITGQAVDASTDVHAAGVILFEMLTLQRPFAGATQQELYRSIVAAPRPSCRSIRREVPRDLDVIVATAMEQDRRRRYRSAADLAEDLRRFREHLPILARPTGRLVALRRWALRHPALATGVAGLVVALMSSLVLLAEVRAALRDVDSLSWVVRLREARRIEEALYPAWPDRAPALEAWLAQHGGPLAAALPALRTEHAAMGPPTADESDRRQLVRLMRVGLIEDLQEYLGPGGGLASVHDRLAWARQVGAATIDAYQAAWREAIAGIEGSKLYGGLRIEPQMGLIPIGANPYGYWEFMHLRSAAPGSGLPARAPDGRLIVTEATGVIFVLLPGGRFFMGAQANEKNEPNYDPNAGSLEWPITEVQLDPFFMGVHEFTQGQWLRLTGSNPSKCAPGDTRQPQTTLAHPVETVSWREADQLLRSQGMLLPTEAQWEYACRAGTSTIWSTGDDPEVLARRANLYDVSGKRMQANWGEPEGHDDGWAYHSPVGFFPPNAFGIHDMHGNVFETTRDAEVDYDVLPRPGDGLRAESDGSGPTVFRGGAFAMPRNFARSAWRVAFAEMHIDHVGFRASRPIYGEKSRAADRR